MKSDERKESRILILLGIVPVVWFALLTAPFFFDGLLRVMEKLPEAMQHPFRIQMCKDSLKTVLLFLACYGMGIGIYLSTRRNYRRGEEHGSAQWGNAQEINKKYSDKKFEANKLMTKHVRISYNSRKHCRNLLTIAVGGSGSGKTRFFCKPNLMQANTSFVVLDPKGENLRDTGHLLEAEGYEVRVMSTIMNAAGFGQPQQTVLPEEIVTAVEDCGFFESIPLWAVTLIGGLFITVLSFIMIMSVYGRFFRLYLYTAIAPVPLASFAGEPTQNIGKSFMKSYAAVCLEGAVIVLACIIFSVFAASPPAVDADAAAVTMVWSYIGELIFNMLVLVGAVKMADRVVREMMGL